MRVDRNAILARTDLAQLADELLGGHKGSGTGARWPSPVPGHPQTGKTPPMTIFRARNGVERWTCWSTGASGTAIDLLVTVHGVSVREALERLAARAGMRDDETLEPLACRPPRAAPTLTPPSASTRSAMRSYIETCEAILWSRRGTTARKWLIEERRLDADVLRANHVGADPGTRLLPRAVGLPRGVGVVFPVLDRDGEVVYLQLRRLVGTGPKYTSPSASAFGSNPRLAWIARGNGRAAKGALVVTEGLCDGLTAAGAGVDAVALLGATMPDQHTAVALAGEKRLLILALDADAAGARSTTRLRSLLASAGRRDVASLQLPDGADLNDWFRRRDARSATTCLVQRLGSRPLDHPVPRDLLR